MNIQARHVVKIIRALESCKTSEQYQSWLAWVSPMKLGEYHNEVWSLATTKVWECVGVRK